MEEDTGVIEYVTAKRMMKARVPLAVWRVLTLSWLMASLR